MKYFITLTLKYFNLEKVYFFKSYILNASEIFWNFKYNVLEWPWFETEAYSYSTAKRFQK